MKNCKIMLIIQHLHAYEKVPGSKRTNTVSVTKHLHMV